MDTVDAIMPKRLGRPPNPDEVSIYLRLRGDLKRYVIEASKHEGYGSMNAFVVAVLNDYRRKHGHAPPKTVAV